VKWEYLDEDRDEVFDKAGSTNRHVSWIDELGECGWELVCIYKLNGHLRVVFKRPLKETEQ